MKVTVDEIIEAAEKNGYIHCRHGWFKDIRGSHPVQFLNTVGKELNPIVEACILGQVAINLGVEYNSLENELNDLGRVNSNWLKAQTGDKAPWPIGSAAIQYNDGSQLSYNQIARKLIGWLEPYRGKTLVMEEATYHARRKGE